MRLAIITLAVIVSPLVASVKPVDGLQQMCAQVPAGNFGLSIHDVNTVNVIYQSPSPQPETSSAHSNHQAALVRWSGWWVLAVFLIYLKWGRYWSQAQEGQAGHASSGLPTHNRLRIGRNYTVSSGTSTLADPPPPADIVHSTQHGCSQASNERGRRSATATASSNGPSSHPNVLSSRAAAQSSLNEGGEHDSDSTNDLVNLQVCAAPGPSPARTLSAPVQAQPSPSFKFPSLPSATPARTRCSSAHPMPKWVKTIPVPLPHRGNASRVRPRYQSLPHERDFERTPPRSAKPSPLKSTLYAGSKDLTLLPAIQCHLLFIAVNIDEEDSESDLRFFQEMLHGSASIHFDSLAGPDATCNNIKTKLTLLYLRAGYISDDSLVLVFLSGKSDHVNSMRLLNDEVVTEANLRDWVSDVRLRSGLSNVQTIPIIFDVCRENKGIPSAEMYQIVELTRTCSLGQRAHALEFESREVFSSCFLLAFFLTSWDVSRSGSPDFEGAFKLRMGQLDQLRLYSYNYWHDGPGNCDQCATEIGGKCAPPGPQEPEWGRLGCDAVANLGAVIMSKYPKYVHKTVQVLTKEMQACHILGADETSPFVPELPVQHVSSGEQHHYRGATMPTLQTPALAT